MDRIDKKSFEIMLENTPKIMKPKRNLEQYETPPFIASHILWEAYMRGDIAGLDIADLGCGSLRLSIGAYILGAKRILSVDIDKELLILDEEYISDIGYDDRINLVLADVRDLVIKKVDVVIMNPPFGVIPQNRGIDLVFLNKALELSRRSVYTIHKWSQGLEKIIDQLVHDKGFEIIYREVFDFPIPAVYETHRRRIHRFKAVFYILRRVEYIKR